MAAETHAATGTHATTGTAVPGHKEPFPPFQPNTFPGQLLWFAIAFGLLYYVMSRILLPKIGAILTDRQMHIAQDLDAAQALRRRSEEAEASYQASLAEAQAKAKGIAQDARDRLAAESDARRKTLEGELATKLAASEAAIRARAADAMGNVRSIASDAAASIVERLIGRAPEGQALAAALDHTVRS